MKQREFVPRGSTPNFWLIEISPNQFTDFVHTKQEADIHTPLLRRRFTQPSHCFLEIFPSDFLAENLHISMSKVIGQALSLMSISTAREGHMMTNPHLITPTGRLNILGVFVFMITPNLMSRSL